MVRRRRASANREEMRRCEELVAGLDIPMPFDARKLCAGIAKRRGRPIRLWAMPMPAGSPCGLWISAAHSDYIVYEERTSKFHQEHIIVHEVGHLLSDHYAAPALPSETSQALLPSLDPDLVNRVLGRTHYSAAEERTAELIASLILERASYWHLASDWTPPEEDTTGIRQRLGRALEHFDQRKELPDRRRQRDRD